MIWFINGVFLPDNKYWAGETDHAFIHKENSVYEESHS